MKRLHFLVLCIFLISLPHSNTSNTPLGDASKKLTDGTEQNSTNISDLYMDVQYLILEHLDLVDLISYANTDKYFSSLAANVFRSKYSQKIVEVLPIFIRQEYALREADDRLYIQHPNSVGRFLKAFGRLIYKMKVNYHDSYCPIDIKKAISRWINEYCSDSLREIEIYDRENSFISEITKPFKNAENVKIRGIFEHVNSPTMTFNEIFPALKSLSMFGTKIQDITSIYHHFPNLVELNVNFHGHIDRGGMEFQENEIGELFKKNPQIRRLKTLGSTEYTFKVASEFLPNLEYIGTELTERPFEIDGGVPKMIFKHVKILEIKIIQHYFRGLKRFPTSFINNTEFESLEELRATLSESFGFEWWIKFMEKNTHLKRFHSINVCINDDGLKQMSQLRNITLDEISIRFCEDVKVQSLIKFVRKNQNIKKFNFKRDRYGDASIQFRASALQEIFGQVWTITSTEDEISLQ